MKTTTNSRLTVKEYIDNFKEDIYKEIDKDKFVTLEEETIEEEGFLSKTLTACYTDTPKKLNGRREIATVYIKDKDFIGIYLKNLQEKLENDINYGINITTCVIATTISENILSHGYEIVIHVGK